MKNLKVRVVPNAKKTALQGMMDDGQVLKVRLAAPPVDGKSNEELVRWLARELGVRTSSIMIVTGQLSRTKVIAVDGMEREAILAFILPEKE